MTVSSSVNKVIYSGNSSTVLFPVNYYFLENSHLKVILRAADGTETVQVLTTNYTVTGAGNPAGGSITMLVAPPTGTTLTIVRNVPATQETDYLANDPFPAESHERALDKLTMLVQETEEVVSRALVVPASTPSTVSTTLPNPSPLGILAWNQNANAINYISPSDIGTAVAYATAYADTFNCDGIDQTFTLTANPVVINNLDVSINGSTQVPNVDYTLSGTTLTMTTPPPVNSVLLAKYKQGLPNFSGDSQDIRYVPAGSGAVNTTVQAKLRETVSVKDFGAVGDGVADDTVAIEAAIAYAATAQGGQIGNFVYFPTGTYLISNKIDLPNRVGLQGANGRGVVIKPHSTFADSYMFHAANGTSAMFGSWIKDMYIDARGKNMTAVVWSQAWQETCGMERVTIQFDGTTNFGFLYSDGYGGAAYCKLSDCEIFSESTYVTAAGVLVSQVSLVGGFVFEWDGGTIAGGTNILPAGIRMVNDTLLCKLLHCEYTSNMVVMSGVGGLSADSLTGSANSVTNVVSLSSTFTGICNLRNIIPNGATGNILDDGVSGRDIAANEGMLAEYSYQPSAFNAQVSTQINNVTGNGTAYTIIFNTEQYDYLGEYNTATGLFTAQKTGKYFFNTQVGFTVTASVSTCSLAFVASSDEYFVFVGDTDNIYSGAGTITLNGSCVVDLTAGQTVKVVLTISGLGSDTVDIQATRSRFTGHWLSR